RASRETVLGGALSGHRYVHVATHRTLDTRFPELSSLVLSLVDGDGNPRSDGFLRLNDIYGLDLDGTDMVVLSACETALGREVRGEGLIGLTRGFLYAGADRVVASLWRVQDRSTARLMEHLYRGLLREGRSPADSLRRAQLAVLDEPGGASSFPYYWAGFVLQGEWR
ncbi:MAG TPA: CHAT domain-containing protein, partial [Thermoanaerobaculia bacterium]|nr:CHAT domain-containing protein [Thermoanaerobaculia bacterium]